MLKNTWAILTATTILLLALSIAGCAGPAPQKNATPQDVVVNYWRDIDSGDYDAAYDLVYLGDENVTLAQWVDDHRVRWGDNGSDIRIYNFTVIDTYPLVADTFPGNFAGIVAVAVHTDVSYYGHNTSGDTQFAVVNTTEGWKLYGAY